MPDGDIFSRTIARGWRRAARLTNAYAGATDVGRAATSGLVRTLRGAEGCPHLDDIIAVVQDVQGELVHAPLLMYDPATVQALRKIANQHLDAIEIQSERHNHTLLATGVARAFVLRMLHKGVADDSAKPLADAIATEVCVRITQRYLFDVQRPLLMGSRFHNYEEAWAWDDSVLEIMAPSINRIARALLRDTTGQAVRAPRWPRESSSTAELLSLPVALGARG